MIRMNRSVCGNVQITRHDHKIFRKKSSFASPILYQPKRLHRICRITATITPITSQVPLWTLLSACAAVSQVVEKRTRLGTLLSAPLLATLSALSFAAIGIMPLTHHVYDSIWTYLMPLATSLFLLQSDLSKLFSSAAVSVIAFMNGALGTVLGTIVAYKLIGPFLGIEGSKIAAALCASYIGGSVNFAAVAGLLGLKSGATLGAAMTSDNLAMALYIAVLMSLPIPRQDLDRILTSQEEYMDITPTRDGNRTDAVGASNRVHHDKDKEERRMTLTPSSESIGLALTAGLVSCSIGNACASYFGIETGGLAITAVCASLIAACAGFLGQLRWNGTAVLFPGSSPFQGAEALGGALMMFFFATIGATAGNLQALFTQQNILWLFVFISIQLSIQIAISLALGKVMNIPLPIVLITANANVGGPGTAAAMATAKKWPLVQDAVLTGSLGYALGTVIGHGMGLWMHSWFSFS